MTAKQPIQIDLDQVLRQKLGSKARWVPTFVVNWLKRIVHQDELNRILLEYNGLEGADFCDAIVREFDVKVDVATPQTMPNPKDSRVIIVSNHPLGGLDGIALIDLFSRHFGTEARFVVNDILMAVEPLQRVFIPINKHGSQSRQSLELLDREMAGDRPIIIFPAGLVSRRGAGGKVRDLEWRKMFISKALQYGRDIVPVHFSGENSSFFYSLANWRKRLGIGFNIEMLYLPDELMKARGKQFSVAVGERIPHLDLRGDLPSKVNQIRNIVYSLANEQ